MIVLMTSRCFVSASIGLDADGNPAETEDDVVDWEEIERADS